MRGTLFVFADDFDLKNQYPCLMIDSSGHLTASYKIRTLQEIQSLSSNNKLFWVLSSTVVKAQIIALPTLNKAKQTIPYILEASLIEDLDVIHYALDKTPLEKGKYRVLVTNKQKLGELIDTLAANELFPDVITSDHIISQNEQLLICNGYFIFSSPSTSFLIQKTLLDLYLDKIPPETTVMTFKNTTVPKTLVQFKHEHFDENYHVYFALRQTEHNPVNLLQGEFKSKSTHSEFLPKISVTLATIACVMLFGNYIIQYVIAKNRLEVLNKQTTAIYQQFFPNAKTVISPRFRIEQYLKNNQNGASSGDFFKLLNAIHAGVKQTTGVTIKNMSYQQGQIQIQISASSFDTLEQLKQTMLNQHTISIKQLFATSQEKKISATWRIMTNA